MNPRQLTVYERNVLLKLLSIDFDGVNGLRDQVNHTTVDLSDPYPAGDPSIFLLVDLRSNPQGEHKIPVIGTPMNQQDVYLEILLHVRDGKLSELEFVYYGEVSDHQLPDPDDLKIDLYEASYTDATLENAKYRCKRCRGTGQIPGVKKTLNMGKGMGSQYGLCPECDGLGWVFQPPLDHKSSAIN